MDTNSRRVIQTAAGVLSLLLGVDLAAQHPGPTRYNLKPGQHLTYDSTSHGVDPSGKTVLNSSSQTEVWVVAITKDGGWRLLLSRSPRSAQPGDSPRRATLREIVLYPDGRIEPIRGANWLDARRLFPLLPPDGQQQWLFAPRPGGRTIHYTLESSTEDMVMMIAKSQEIGDEVYEVSRHSTQRFGARRGLLLGSEGSFRQQFGFQVSGTTRLELTNHAQVDPATLAQLDSDAGIYFEAMDDYEQSITEATDAGAKVPQLLNNARRALAAIRFQVTDPRIRTQIDDLIRRHPRQADRCLERVRDRAARVGLAAPDWTLFDLQGRLHQLSDYRGKIVILDFWNRGCAPCIQAMAHLVRIAERFGGPDVAIFGMNTDPDVQDAKLVEQVMQLSYPNLQATSILAKYSVRSYPFLLIIDQSGIIRHAQIGASRTLEQDLARHINDLLPEPPP